MALGFGFYLADSVEDAVERLRPFHDERYKWFAPFGLERYTDEQAACGAPQALPPARRQSRTACSRRHGSAAPDKFIETFRELEEKYPGLEDIVLQWPEGMPWHELSAQLEIFSKEVLPAFQGRS